MCLDITRRAPYGARGLKLQIYMPDEVAPSRAPYGARGLKCNTVLPDEKGKPVAPRMGRVD